jgi:hypothetical protein
VNEFHERVRRTRIEAGDPEELPIALHVPIYPPRPRFLTLRLPPISILATPALLRSLGKAANDLAGVLAAVWRGFSLSHDAGPVSGLYRIAFAGELGQLDLLDIFPVRCLDRNGEPLHSAHDRTIALGS